jgi:hypothetical protein
MNTHTLEAFATPLERVDGALGGPWRSPRQMLAEQSYDSHASIHDDATAQKLGFKGGTIEGPTHFSQFAPLGEAVFGRDWFTRGCASAHYRTVVYEGEAVRAFMGEPDAAGLAPIWMTKQDGAEVLRGTASVGDAGPTALEARLAGLPPLEQPVLLSELKVGMRGPRHPVVMAADQHMGDLYPFTLNRKLERITEPSPWYAGASPFGGAIIPMEMISVLFAYTSRVGGFPVRGPSVGLFADQEIRLRDGPLMVGEPLEIEREIVALSGSKRTESVWIRTRAYRPGAETPAAEMLLNSATLKDSYAAYEADRAALYG